MILMLHIVGKMPIHRTF